MVKPRKRQRALDSFVLETPPYQPFLDRTELPEKIAAAYADQFWLLRELASYGSALIRRCIEEQRSVDIPDAIMVLNLGKHAVAMIDAAAILLSQSAVLAAYLQVRALLEASISLEWIHSNDTAARADAYYVGDLRNQLMWANGMIPGTAEYDRLKDARKAIQEQLGNSDRDIETEAREQREALSKRLEKGRFAACSASFDRLKGKRLYDRFWYEVVGARSIREMAGQIGRVAEYDFFYTIASGVMHGSSYRQHFLVRDGKAHMRNIRWPEGIDTLMNLTVSIGLRTYRVLLTRYRPHELARFSEKYVRDWQQKFRQIRPPNVTFGETPESV